MRRLVFRKGYSVRNVVPSLVLVFVSVASLAAQDVTVLVGDPTPSPHDVTSGPLNIPFGVDFDPQGNMLIAEYVGGRVLRLQGSGNLQLVAGLGKNGYEGDGGPATQATFNDIHNLAVTSAGDVLLSDHNNHVVRRIDASSGNVSTFAGSGTRGFSGDGGAADQAQFNVVMSVALTPDGTALLVADLANHRIRLIDLRSNTVTTVAGNGKVGVPQDGQLAIESPLVDPRAAAMDDAGNLYIVERNGNALRVVRPSGIIETVAGTGKSGWKDGIALEAQLAEPKHLAIDKAGHVYIADDRNHMIRKYDPQAKTLTTVLGRGDFKLQRPHGVTVRGGELFIADSYHHRILKMPLP
ncbi:Serine/threonine-protein kinase PknD [Rubripirellula lacrimiformis]|uniref:Serine/threonine-protein kinase PknD n=1 Tax=Rubripirellula lacrimiformis TaxID=1930273 RepID=A0A517NJ08_9BACT|nr:hypothetical protein [Rubripirellula lacrimiformis]QDT07078.1 Serine/threonine-protein kinase PknD [Rubripirellula lacrimiformis]